ncbi:hypothetical protein [Novosphingobium sp. BW1]|uniref:hypothetical protein n=1 Tax=Novosphingobium sp. BW1 TaxID=2592621 RepID=UPI0011DEB475|nr:hypothetical protein [Novosphingobium sp. BW1]TYC78795.1 hypothetical protein FMM79_20835 [Novosphingobium sp. BW1]
MLFSYSPEGFQDNWVHETLIAILEVDLDRIANGEPRLPWSACIPEEKRNVLRRRYGIRNRRATVLDALEVLQPEQREEVRGAMIRQNALPGLLGDGQPCVCLTDLPATVREPIKDFFVFGFDILADLGLRDENYKRIYDALRYKVCAFCGVEILDAPGQKREALDHFLPIATYPFAGSNFRNLSPMGTKCNSRYKGTQNVLVDPLTGNRRSCADPFDSPNLSISLDDSRPFEGDKLGPVTCPDWRIQWNGGDEDKLDTWESVFNIAERYRASTLNPNFRDWIDHFCDWASRSPNSADSPANLRRTLHEFAMAVVPEGLAEAAFLKRATILMLEQRCDDSDDGARIFEWLSEQIREREALAA